ncbi:MAG: tRNA (adenosine(37)-N6)-threonylcarbamoyltransferase complex dimerization subunit type 1 TsaB [Candidatus Kapabacteria bacterium]|nr:tRNA (adenosine(37)-N6)-threonylcarbamoyltransferase complex dimerization subunit type 1 TsaB [Candidatus Kapabacteria bacterium]
MTILSIETSGSVCGVALATLDGESYSLRTAIEVLIPNVHDGALARLAVQCMSEAGVGIVDIDVVAVSSGPGSFTGLRIGASFAKGLCFTGSPRLLAVPTMQSVAAASTEVATLAARSAIIVVIPSHRDLVYLQRYDAHAMPLTDVAVMTITKATEMCGPDTLVVGPGASLVSPAPVSGLGRCSPRFVSMAASIMLRNSDVVYADPQTFEPGYRQEFVPKA